MREPLTVVALDAVGEVIEVELLRPGAVIRVPGAAWMLELPATAVAPDPGDRLRMLLAID